MIHCITFNLTKHFCIVFRANTGFQQEGLKSPKKFQINFVLFEYFNDLG